MTDSKGYALGACPTSYHDLRGCSRCSQASCPERFYNGCHVKILKDVLSDTIHCARSSSCITDFCLDLLCSFVVISVKSSLSSFERCRVFSRSLVLISDRVLSGLFCSLRSFVLISVNSPLGFSTLSDSCQTLFDSLRSLVLTSHRVLSGIFINYDRSSS